MRETELVEIESKKIAKQLKQMMPSKEFMASITITLSVFSEQVKLMTDYYETLIVQHSENLIDIFQQLQSNIYESLQNLCTIGTYGWTIPLNATAEDLDNLLNKDLDETDAFFEKWFTKARIDSLLRRLVSASMLTKWHELILQIQIAMKHKHYQICVPSAVLILEGVIADYLNIPNTNIKETIHRHQELITDKIDYLMWISVDTFIKSFYQKVEFNQSRLSIINRHWIMHGRDDPALWTKLDVLRIINTIGAIITVSEPKQTGIVGRVKIRVY